MSSISNKRIDAEVYESEVPQPRRRSVYGPATPGSYGHLVYTLAQGLDLAQTKGWLSSDEAKREFRSHIQVVQEDEVKAARIADLEAEVAAMEQELLEARARIESTKQTTGGTGDGSIVASAQGPEA